MSEGRSTRRMSPASVMQGTCSLLAIFIVAVIGSYRAFSDISAYAYRSLEGQMQGEEPIETRERPDRSDQLSTASWISVEETPISLPVMQITEGMPSDYYLSHDAWGRVSPLGCPFLDERCSATGRHVLISGHRIIGTDEVFSPIAECYQAEEFKRIGDATWTPQAGTPERFTPLCALQVPARFADIQQFEFADTHEFRIWLRNIVQEADVCADDWARLAAAAKRALTLVTCAETNGHSSTRTLVVFVQ